MDREGEWVWFCTVLERAAETRVCRAGGDTSGDILVGGCVRIEEVLSTLCVPCVSAKCIYAFLAKSDRRAVGAGIGAGCACFFESPAQCGRSCGEGG